MGDDLAAFFAKKKSKGTKKKAIRLDDVGQQLELNLKLEKVRVCVIILLFLGFRRGRS